VLLHELIAKEILTAEAVEVMLDKFDDLVSDAEIPDREDALEKIITLAMVRRIRSILLGGRADS
jgi:hypothetical protein